MTSRFRSAFFGSSGFVALRSQPKVVAGIRGEATPRHEARAIVKPHVALVRLPHAKVA